MRASKNPLAITVNGEAQVVVQDAESYQAMVDELARANLMTAILEGEADISAGRTRDIEEVFGDLKTEYDLQG